MRFIMVILLLAVCFLLGIIYANGQPSDLNHTTNDAATIDQLKQSENQHKNKRPPLDNKDWSAQTDAVDETPHMFQKVASSLEGIVNGFYNMVVDVMYGFAEMFF